MPVSRSSPSSKPTGAAANGGRWRMLIPAVFSAVLAILSWPTAVVSVVALLPTLAARIVDRSDGTSAAYCVGGLNLGAAFPYLLGVLTASHPATAAHAVLTDVYALVVIYGAAGGGWVLYLALPRIVQLLFKAVTERRIAQLEEAQRRLVERWGRTLAGKGAGGPIQPTDRTHRLASNN